MTTQSRLADIAVREYQPLLTVAEHEGIDRLFFGAIDWRREPVELVEITTPQAMREAFAIVGFA